jgi:hypothetical protein
MYFTFDFSMYVNYVIGILTGIALNMLIAFGSMTIFKILILPVHGHDDEDIF